MGIDPGTTIMGYGVISIVGKKVELVVLGSIELQKYADHYLKLRQIFIRSTQLMESFLPDEIAIESPFQGKNVQSMLKLGRAQGVAMTAALMRDIPICEYAPRKIKQMITGAGDASKEQVAAMLKTIFNINPMPTNLDATDGLAAALCHYYVTSNAALNQIESCRQSAVGIGKSHSKKKQSWDAFVKQNPDKVQ
jgi:crossover junction endodeoxyribonuclease RuvC